MQRSVAQELGLRLRQGGRGMMRLLYPPQCPGCDLPLAEAGGLCPDCWAETRFLTGAVCDGCGAGLPGQAEATAIRCDACLADPPPWARGRAVFAYEGAGRKLVLALKHGDRHDLLPALGGWMHRAAAPLLLPDMLVVPVPLHWWRLFRRRANQSALLSARVARLAGLEHAPDLLRRIRATPSQEGRGREARQRNLEGAIRAAPRGAAVLRGRPVLLVDDVMTSGATFAAATRALQAAGASQVVVLALARVAKPE